MIACTELSSVGWNVELMMPVVASNATMYGWLTTGAPTVFCCSCVNVPPSTIVLPTCAIASTSPSRMLGVQFAGSADTIVDCGVCTAQAAPAPIPTAVVTNVAIAAATAAKRRMLNVSSTPSPRPWPVAPARSPSPGSPRPRLSGRACAVPKRPPSHAPTVIITRCEPGADLP